jgi:hypothetical protein
VFEDYMTWNSGTTWLANPRPAFRSRLAVHMSTASGKGVRGVISPQGIARGRSDSFLVTMNRNLAHSRRIFYIRIMGEANGYWNAYCPYNKDGTSRGARFSTNNYRQAWRRTVLILRGGPVATIDKRLRALKMRPIKAKVTRSTKLPHPKVTFIWAPQAHGDPNIPQNEPQAFWPGSAFVDWVGTDFYEGDNFNYLNAYYSQFTGGKPFDLSEWGVVGYDHPSFVHDIFNWVRSHPHVRMFNYFQGYGSSNPYNPHHYPKSVAALRKELRSAKFPRHAHEFRHPPKHRTHHHKPPQPRKPGKPPNPPLICVKVPILGKICVPKP